MLARDIPIAHTPAGGWHGEMPPPVLADCTEPIAPGAPDLRGTWKAHMVEQDGKPLPDHPLNRHVERIEQCGDRVVITAGRVIHDMRADGTLEHGVNDVMEMDLKTTIHVAAVFKSGRLELHPGGIDPARPPLVTRELVGDELIWNYAVFRVALRKLDARDARS
jgi:hypothetical protein